MSWPEARELTAQERLVIQHGPGLVCDPDHCYSCGVDEPMGGSDYRICPECFHVYRTARALRRAYRRGAWECVKTSWAHRHEDPEGNWWEMGGSPYGSPVSEFLWWVRRGLFIRASKIHFCQHCSHDF